MKTALRPLEQRFRVAVLDDYQVLAMRAAEWSILGPSVEVVCFYDHVDSADQLIARLQGFQAVVAMRERSALTAEVLGGLSDLRLVVATGHFNEAVDLGAAQHAGIVVCGTEVPEGQRSAVELTLTLLLAVAKNICASDRSVRSGGWQQKTGAILSGKTLGLLGLGRIGLDVVPFARALNMRICAWSPNLTEKRASDAGVLLVDHDELFAGSDVVSVHLRLGERSRWSVGRDEFRLMKSGAFLVNTSRGPIVRESALIEALQKDWIGGAALDVFDQEPLPVNHPLRSLPNVVLSPHVGYVTNESFHEYFSQVVEDIGAFLGGSPIRIMKGADE